MPQEERDIYIPGVSTARPSTRRHLVQIVDASGSMQPLAEEVRSGIVRQLESAATIPDVETRVTLAYFADRSNTPALDVPISAADPQQLAGQYAVGGMTALHRTALEVLTALKKKLVAEGRQTEAVNVFIYSDGQDNLTSPAEKHALRELISELRGEGWNWDINLIGANIDVLMEAEYAAIDQASTLGFAPTREGTRSMFRSLNDYYVASATTARFNDAPNNLRLSAFVRNAEALRTRTFATGDTGEDPVLV